MWLKSVSSPRQWGTVTLNSRNAGPLVRSRPRSLFVTMQEAELAWWKRYLDHPTARQRMWALYGARYYDFFWRDMGNAENTVEIGAGPVPVMEIMSCSRGTAVDTLGDAYRAAGLAKWPYVPIGDVPDGYADTLLLLNVLDHTDDPQELVRDGYRVLRVGGRALVFVHLNQGDDKHRRVSESEPGGWLGSAGFLLERWAIKPPTVYDPSAYMAVVVKP